MNSQTKYLLSGLLIVMILIAVVVPLAVLMSSTDATEPTFNYKTKFFETKVDHFGYANNDTFKIKVLYSDEYFDFENPGPIFFYPGNEGPVEMFANNTGIMWEWAIEFKALLIFAEHRYYGDSKPYGAKSYSGPEYYGYLTAEQAMADYADILRKVKETWPGAKKSKVVAFGGSYGGMLGTWMRIKYPWLIHAVFASSAPVFLFEGLTPCEAYNGNVTIAFRYAGGKCVENIRKSWDALDRKAKTGEAGAKFVHDNFRICQPASSSTCSAVREWLYGTYGNMAMVNYPYEANFLRELPANHVNVACEFLNKDFKNDEDLLFGIYQAVNVFHNYTGKTLCNDVRVSDGPNLGTTGWKIQKCNEMVMPTCSDGVSDMFYKYEWNFTEYRNTCEQIYKMTPGLYKIRDTFGGKDIKMVTNVLFTNGDRDPWASGGVFEDLSPNLPAIVIKGVTHHHEFRSTHPKDPPQVIEARNRAKKYISEWLAK